VKRRLRQFHTELNVHDGWAPMGPSALVPEQLRKLRRYLLDEEVEELAQAMEAADIVEIADALGDIAYVVMGTAFTYGIDLDLVIDEIHRSNMTKTNVPGKGKLVKGDGYRAPRLGQVLDAMQGNASRRRRSGR
jgi:predicted HAD superfamily Cof-like phosphohydrolase